MSGMLSEQEFRENTSYKCSYEEYKACCCENCYRSGCVHRNAYRRLPIVDGGLGLCRNLSSLVADYREA